MARQRLSMRFQASAIIIVGFLLSHGAGYLFYTLDRRDALEMTEATDFAERAGSISRLIRDLPPASRESSRLVAPSAMMTICTSCPSADQRAIAPPAPSTSSSGWAATTKMDFMSRLRPLVR